MTIALGVLATDGLVIAADTQVTAGYLKMSQSKVSWAGKSEVPPGTKRGQIVVSGAGVETSIKYLRNAITSGFQRGDMSVASINEAMREETLNYHTTHVTPHGRDGSLDVWMIVGALDNHEGKLWTTDRSVVNEESIFGAVGEGAAYARIVMNQAFAWMDTIGSMLLAAYVVWRVKRTIDSVGEETDIFGIRRDRSFIVERPIAQQMADIFAQYEALSAKAMHSVFCGNAATPSFRRLKRETEKLVQQIDRVPEWALPTGQLTNPTSSEISQT